MLNPGQNPSLIKKALQPPFIIRCLAFGGAGLPLGVGTNRHPVSITERPLDRKILLDGHPVFQMGIQRLIGDPKAARPQDGINAVLVQQMTGRQRISSTGSTLGGRS